MLANDTANTPGQKGWQPNANRNMIQILIAMGDIPQAEGYLRRNIAFITEARTSGHPRWRESYATRGRSWEADIESARAAILEARGHEAQPAVFRPVDAPGLFAGEAR